MRRSFLSIKESPLFARVLPVLILIAISVVFTIMTNGKFSEPRNLMLIINQAMITATIATGAVFIFGTGNVNIAMGASTSLVATIAVMVYLSTQSIPLMILSGIAMGVVIMMLMSILSTMLRVSVMFVSIVMMVLLDAIKQTILGAGTISIPYSITSMMTRVNFTYIAFGIFFILCLVLFHLTSIGRAIKFIGANKYCAEQSGLFMNKYLFLAFTITGIGVGLASMMIILRTGSINASTASSLNMDVVLAIVLGGMSVFGGSRSFVYAGVLGAITVTLLNNGLLMLGVSPTILQLVRGIFFLTLIFAGQKRPEMLPSGEI
ncbi:ABC transporter permease [Alkalibacter saccharofermentans]|uniref:Autoinducer 2 import system permease protein LsrD n=1 Tax=Alkalibacter saccharofermentans DSM 14828 TaxID=1120975 RepID=A0A1M4W3P0_9FIRM|nr:ABC transporter permease [Alkalibacter saccharofermentans]SHE75836.1 ribose transport system permease protein [Alkalibacter saccharofermentans DSM 14828]